MRATLLAIAALTLIGGSAATAEAGHGIVGGVYGRVGTGRAINGSHYSYNRGFYGGHGGARYSYYRAHPYGAYYGGGRHGHGHHGHGHHQWHDTSHYDYYPGGYVRHYDHYDYVPPHYDWHQEGHWDHH
jgi:hypothetical protein